MPTHDPAPAQPELERNTGRGRAEDRACVEQPVEADEVTGSLRERGCGDDVHHDVDEAARGGRERERDREPSERRCGGDREQQRAPQQERHASATPAPQRSVSAPPTALTPAASRIPSASTRPRPASESPNVRLMSMTATANAPAKLPNTTNAAATGRSVGRSGVRSSWVVGSTATGSARADQAFAGSALPGPRRRSSTFVASLVRSPATASAPSMTNPASAIIWRSASPACPSLVR